MSIREYKSSVFSMLLEELENALDVYNALHGTNYTDSSMVKIQKLDGGVLLSVYNDASFILDSFFNVYEHQSTYCPNMPLRFLIYFADLLWDMVKKNNYDIYGSKKIPIPTPQFVVFYNGEYNRPGMEEMRLSDLYERQCEVYDLDLKCIAYNINPGYNEELSGASTVLSGYSTFVDKVRVGVACGEDYETAINHSIDYCLSKGILVDFFTRRRLEVVEKALIDMTFEKREKLIARDNREIGREEGIEIGMRQGISQGMRQGISQGISQGLQCLVATLCDIFNDFNQVYERVIKNEIYHDCTEDEVRRIWKEIVENDDN